MVSPNRFASGSMDRLFSSNDSTSLATYSKVGMFLKDMANAQPFDEIYANYVGSPSPARTLVQSSFSIF